jgi:YVTN family beta-propeller protein
MEISLAPVTTLLSGRNSTGDPSLRDDPSLEALGSTPLSGPYSIFDFQRVGSSVVDPRTGYLYVANNEGSEAEYSRITIYDPARSAVIGFVDGVTGPMVLDSSQGELVVLQGNGAVFVSTTTNQVVASVSGLAPEGWRHPVLALEPSGGLVYAAYNFQTSAPIWLGSTIHVLSTRLHAAIAQITGLWWTHGIAYNPQDGNLYLANVIGGITVIDPRTNAVVGAFSGLDGPNQIAYNPVDGNLYIASGNGRFVNENGTVKKVCTAGIAIVDPRARQVVGNISGFHPDCYGGPQYIVYDAGDQSLFVANDTTIVAIDARSRAFRWEISGLSYPGPLSQDSLNHHVYVASGDALLDLDPAARSVRSIGKDYATPSAIAYDSTRNRIYAANRLGTSVVIIDGSTNRIFGRLEGFGLPVSVTYNPIADELFVGNEQNSTLSIVDLRTNRIEGTITNVLSWAVLYDGRSRNLFVATAGGMAIVSGQTNAVIANLTAFGSLVPMAVDSIHGRVFALTRPNSTYPGPVRLLAFDTLNLSLLWNANATDLGISSMAFDPLNGNLYAGRWSGTGVAVIESTSGNVVTTIPGSFSPETVLFNPANGYVYVADTLGSGVLRVIDGATNTMIGQVGMPDSPHGMVYNEANREMYVAAGLFFFPGVVVAVPSLQYHAGPSSDLLAIAAVVGGVSSLLVAVVVVRRHRRRRKGDGRPK